MLPNIGRASRLAAALFVAATALGAAGSASAEMRLTTLDAATILGLQPLLERGEVVLIEAKKNGRLRQGTVLKIADASAEAVLAVVADMESYPRFIPNVVRSEIVQSDGVRTDLAWELEIPFVNLSGVNRVVDERPAGIRYRPLEGDIKQARFRWEATPLGDGRSVVAHYVAADIGEASWFLEKFIEARPSVEPGAVVSTALVLVKAICAEAARRQGKRVPPRPRMGGRHKPKIDSVARELAAGGVRKSLRRLLKRGVVGLVRSKRDGRLAQAVMLQDVGRAPEAVHAVARDPRDYPEFIPSIASVSITQREGNKLRYLSEIKMPLIDLEVLTELKEMSGLRLAFKIVSGDLKSGRYAYEFLPMANGNRTLMVFYTNTDIRDQSWFLKKLIEKEPYYQHGLNLGLGFVNVRAVAKRTMSQP